MKQSLWVTLVTAEYCISTVPFAAWQCTQAITAATAAVHVAFHKPHPHPTVGTESIFSWGKDCITTPHCLLCRVLCAVTLWGVMSSDPNIRFLWTSSLIGHMKAVLWGSQSTWREPIQSRGPRTFLLWDDSASDCTAMPQSFNFQISNLSNF